MRYKKLHTSLRPSETLGQSVRRAAAWQGAAVLLLRLVNIAVTAIIAHILSPHDFGVFAVALTIYSVASSVAELGVMSCVMRRDLDLDSFAPTAATASWITSILIAAAMVAFARPFAAALGAPDAAGPTRIMAIAIVLIGAFAVPSAYLFREFGQDKNFLASLSGFLASTPVLIILSLTGSGASAFAWSRIIAHLVAGCVMLIYQPKHYRPGFSMSALPEMLRFGLPFAGANLLSFVLLNVDYMFVGRLLGATELGTYVLAFNIASLTAGLLNSVILSVSLPAFSELKADPQRLRETTAKATRSVAFVALPLAALTLTLAHPLVITVYGARWEQAAPVLSILSIYGGISVICVLFANILSGLGRTRVLFALQLIWLSALIPAMSIGVHQRGIVGAGVAHVVVSLALVFPAYVFVVTRVTRIGLARLAAALRPSLAVSAAAATVAKLASTLPGGPLLQLIAGGAAGMVLYLVLAGPPLASIVLNRRVSWRPARGAVSE